MTEWEKMIAGEPYRPEDPELKAMRSRARALCYQSNQIPPLQEQSRNAILRQLLGRVGTHFTVEPTFWCDYGKNISLGEAFYANFNCVILDCAPVTFGDHVMVAPNCGFYTATHPIDPIARASGLEYAKPITVGSHVWFGGNVTVLPGVTIGDHVVIGAGSVVTHDIPDHVVAVGNPCRPIKSVPGKTTNA